MTPDLGGAAPPAQPPPQPPIPGRAPPRTNWYSETTHELFGSLPNRLREAVVAGFIAALSAIFVPLIAFWKGQAETKPWETLWVLAPAAVIVWLILQIPATRNRYRPRGRALGLLLLVGPLTTGIVVARAFDSTLQLAPLRRMRQTFDLSRAGDLHYFVAKHMARDPRLAIVTIPPATPAFRRAATARVLNALLERGTRGVAIDLSLDAADSTPLDFQLLKSIQAFQAAKLPVVVGSTEYADAAGEVRRRAMTPIFASVLPDSQRGHLIAFTSPDGRVRSIPTLLEGHPDRRAFAWVAAARIEGRPLLRVELPDQELQFLKPTRGIPIVQDDSLVLGSAAWDDLIRDRFVFIGERSADETVSTAFGSMLGVQVQAMATTTLIRKDYVRRCEWWLTLVAGWACLLWLAVVASIGKSRGVIVLWSAALAVACALFCAAAMSARLVWVDLSYVTFTILIYTVFLLAVPGAIQPPGAPLAPVRPAH